MVAIEESGSKFTLLFVNELETDSTLATDNYQARVLSIDSSLAIDPVVYDLRRNENIG